MKKTNIEMIKDLLTYLSERDKKLTDELLEKKDFHATRDLIKSCIQKIKRCNSGLNSEERLIMLELLYSEVDNYIILIYDKDGEDDLDFDEIDLEINEIIEDIYE